MVSECFLFLICIQQLPKLNASAANIIKVVAMEASSIHTSDLVKSVITTIPKGALAKNAEPCGFDLDNFASNTLLVIKINSQG